MWVVFLTDRYVTWWTNFNFGRGIILTISKVHPFSFCSSCYVAYTPFFFKILDPHQAIKSYDIILFNVTCLYITVNDLFFSKTNLLVTFNILSIQWITYYFFFIINTIYNMWKILLFRKFNEGDGFISIINFYKGTDSAKLWFWYFWNCQKNILLNNVSASNIIIR